MSLGKWFRVFSYVLEIPVSSKALKFPDMGSEAELLKQTLRELQETRIHLARHILRIPHYFEMVYTLVGGDRDALDEVLRLFRESIIYWFELYYPYIQEQRVKWKSPDIYVEFEELYRQAKAARKK